MQHAAPISDDEADRLFSGQKEHAVLALAVSGGADSLALLDLAHRWSRRGGERTALVVLTVDHMLRPGSAAEAAMVAALAQERGLRHETLRWEGTRPATGIEAAAREARYRLLGGAAQRAGAGMLVAAHHQDDQAETVLMRLGRGSGLAGLAGMEPRRILDGGIVLARPFLEVPKARLVATAHAAGFAPVADEMNSDPRFARARLRALAPALAREGIDAATIARAARLFRRADEALAIATRAFLARSIITNPLGVVHVPRAALAGEPDEIRLRALAAIIGAAGGGGRAPGEDSLATLDAAVKSTHPFRRTLGGAVIRTRGHDIVFHREAGRTALPELALPPGHCGVWDGRFRVAIGAVDGVTLGPLAARGYAELPERCRARPRAAAETVPAFRRQGRLLAVPAVGFTSPGGEEFVAVEVAVAALGGRGGASVSGDGARARGILHKRE